MTTGQIRDSSDCFAKPVKRYWADRLAEWGKYAAAAGAALATGASAEASIVYVHPASPEDAVVPGAAPYVGNDVKQFTVDGIGLELNANVNLPYYYAPARFAQVGATGTRHLNWFGMSGFAYGFRQDQVIRNQLFNGRTFRTAPYLRRDQNSGNGGVFGSGNSNFAGFRLPASKGGGFGWMRFVVIDRDNDSYPDEVQAIDWAYDDAGGGINAGQVPEPSSAALALLAVGSAGVVAWRRRRPSRK